MHVHSFKLTPAVDRLGKVQVNNNIIRVRTQNNDFTTATDVDWDAFVVRALALVVRLPPLLLLTPPPLPCPSQGNARWR